MLVDWSQGWRETLTWRTAVASSRDGASESRRQVRPVPTRWVDGAEWVSALRDVEILGSWSGNLAAYWPGVSVAAASSSGTTVSIATPALLGYEVDAWVMAVTADGTVSAQLIEDVTSSEIELVGALVVSAGDLLVPAFVARRDSVMPVTWLAPRVRVAGSTWEVQRPAARWDSTALGPVDDMDAAWDPVETFSPYGKLDYEVVWWRGDHADAMTVLEDRYDAPGGSARRVRTSDVARHSSTRTRTLFGRREIWSARRMLYRRAGRLNGAFIPAGMSLPFLGWRSFGGQDFAAFEAGLNIDDDLRRVLAFVLEDGSREYVGIDVWHEDDDVIVSVTAGEVWTPVDEIAGVVSVDWLMFGRLDSDVISFEYASPTVATLTLDWVSLPWPPDVDYEFVHAVIEVVSTVVETYVPPSYSESMTAQIELVSSVSETYVAPVYSESMTAQIELVSSVSETYIEPSVTPTIITSADDTETGGDYIDVDTTGLGIEPGDLVIIVVGHGQGV